MSIALSLLSILTAQAATLETTTARTVYGAEIRVEVSVPDGLTGKAPALVIAPGAGYHMGLPIVRQLADTVAAKGVIAYRFNWNYFTQDPANGESSPRYEREIEDMQAVVALAKADPRVDPSQLLLAGKSLGSLVSYRVFAADPSLKALALLTPICTARYDEHDQPLPAPQPSGEKNYPGLASLAQPTLFATSSADPACDLPMLYDFLRGTSGNVHTMVVGGGHGWELARGEDELTKRRNAENVAMGVAFVAHWIQLVLAR